MVRLHLPRGRGGLRHPREGARRPGGDGARQQSWQEVGGGRGRGTGSARGREWGGSGDRGDSGWASVGAKPAPTEPFGYEALREGNRRAFGTDAVPAYDFAAAKYILSFGADFLGTWASPVGFQDGFADAHGLPGGKDRAMAKHVLPGPSRSPTRMDSH